MKLLSLNYWGLGWPEVVRDLRSLYELCHPMVVFLLETHFFLDLRRSLGYANGVGVGSQGRGGGLSWLWTNEVCVKL